ncbi:MAG: hypothetical protein AMJ46_14675 [Latescibacteria bacterium DG_63]|nr:MAG: hypothetical protein AMJ46_14675 [Latescibacteria bacterium DG_63]
MFVMATGSGATPHILQPGDSGRIPVYYLGLKQPWNFSDRTVEFELGVLVGESAEQVALGESSSSVADDPIDWPALKEEMRPEWMPADAWDAIWENFTEQVGSTWGDYASMLRDNMWYLFRLNPSYMHIMYMQPIIGLFVPLGEDPDPLAILQSRDAGMLTAFEILQASAALGPYSILTGDVDAYSPAPGMPLSFTRTYGQSIDSRYMLGPLGRGWTHNWDIRAQVLSDGDVIVHGPNGADRYFTKEGASYTASPGDYGILTKSGSYRLTEQDGTVWQFRAENLLDYVEDTNGNRITAGYESGRLTSLSHSNGDQLLLDYNEHGRISHITDPRGPEPDDDHVTIFDYDGSGEYLLTVTAPGSRTTTYAYETAGTLQQRHALLSVEYPDATHDYFVYDSHGRLSETHRDGGAEAVTYSYGSAGTVTVEDAVENQAVLYYDKGGQLARVRNIGIHDAWGGSWFWHDSNYQLTSLIGPNQEQYGYSYDDKGNLVGIENPERHDTDFTYEPSLNSLTGFTDARGNGIEYDYDASGNLISMTYEDGTVESFSYDSTGNVISWTNRCGNTTIYGYNAAGQMTSKDYDTTPGLTDYEYQYDDAGNLISATGPEGTTAMTYDPDTDWMTRIDYPGGQFFTFEYDNAGQRTKRTDQDGNVVNYLYDSVGRLDQITDTSDALIVDYEYDEVGQLSRKTLSNGVYASYEYDNGGQLLHLVNYDPGDMVVSRFDYTYDASGYCTSMTTLDGIYTYGYDQLGQLITVAHPNGHIVEYVYDAVGNRVEVIDDGVVTEYATNDMNQYTDVGGVIYAYDDDGNMISKTEGSVTTTYEYNAEKRLIGVTAPTDTWTYTYDALGNRIASTHNGVATNYIIDPIGIGNVAAEYDDGGNLIARYLMQ